MTTYVRVDLEATLLLETLGQLPRLIDPNLIDLTLYLLSLPPLEVFLLPLLSLLGGNSLPLGLGGSLLGRSSDGKLLGELLSSSNDGPSSGRRSLLGLGLSEGEGKERTLGVLGRLGDGRVDELNGRVKDRGKSGQLRSNEVRRRRLKVVGDGSRSRGVGSRSRSRSARKRLIEEDDRVADVIDSDGELRSLAGGHDKLLELLFTNGKRLDELEDVVDRDGIVNLGELLEEAREDDVSDGSGVLAKIGRGREGFDDGRGR